MRSLLAAALLILVACQRESPTSPRLNSDIAGPALSVITDQSIDDVSRDMRTRLRAMPDDSARAEIERGGNVVTIGFRTPGSDAGVDRRGTSLVSATDLSLRVDQIVSRSRRVIYRFKEIPAMIVELVNADSALALRKLSWVDYVAPATHLLTPDIITATCIDQNGNGPARGTPENPQIIPWQDSKIRADQVWPSFTGNISGTQALAILDDGADEYQSSTSLGPDLDAIAYGWYVPPSAIGDGIHGTPVTGVAAARNNLVGTVGSAPGAFLRIDKINDSKSGMTNWDYWTALAINNESSEAAVINISLSAKVQTAQPPASFAPMYDAIKNAYYNHNVIIVASTGNDSSATTYTYPAAYPEVVGVGGSNSIDLPVYNDYAPGDVEVSAPATNIVTVCKGGQTGYADGTSFSTPLVAGAFMLLRQAHPTETAARLRQRMTLTAVSMGNVQRSGAGRIDVAAAIGYVFPPPPSVTINGPIKVRPNVQCAWTSAVTGGMAPFSYVWTIPGSTLGYTADLTTSLSASTTLTLNVVDALGQPGVASKAVTVSSTAQICQL